MNTPTTTTTAEGIDSALDAINPAGLTDTQLVVALDTALAGQGDIKAIGVAGNWWASFILWLRDLIRAGKEVWQKWSDFIKSHLEGILAVPWYWMPLPTPPVPGMGV
jgi:hypothetical protein